MGEYYGEKKMKKPPKYCKNNMGKLEFKNDQEHEARKRKMPKRKKAEIPLHPHGRKRQLRQRWQKITLLAQNFAFPQEYRDKSLLFDLKKTSEEQSSRQYWKKYLMTTNIILNIEMERITCE